MKRLFAAIKVEPDPNFVKTFAELNSTLHYERIKWVETENIHLTLKFFGETPEDLIPGILSAMAVAASTVDPFLFSISDTGIFGSRYDPKVIWFGIKNCEPLLKLAANLNIGLEKAGWPGDRQNFVPHLTIGRIRQLRDKELFQRTIARFAHTYIQQQAAGKLTLFESILRREGPLYLEVASYKLGIKS